MLRYLLAALALLVFCPGGAAADSNRYRIKFATVAPEGSAWVKAITDLDTTLRAASEDRLGFLVYAGGIAGDEVDVLKKIRMGQLHAAAFSGVGLGAVLPSVRVLDLPMLFRDNSEVDRVRAELAPYFAERFSENGFRFLSWAEVGPVSLFSNAPIRTMEDLRGAKVWVWAGDPIAKETFNALGINPISLSVADVTTALSTGMIDTVYAPPLGALALQWQHSLKYMSALPLAYASAAVLLSNAFYDRLPPDLAALLDHSLPPAMAKLTEVVRRQFEEALQELKKAGVTVVPAPDGEQLAPFMALNRRVSEKLAGEMYPPELLEEVYEILGRPLPAAGAQRKKP